MEDKTADLFNEKFPSIQGKIGHVKEKYRAYLFIESASLTPFVPFVPYVCT